MNLVDIVKPFVYFDKGFTMNISDGIHDKIRFNHGVIVNLDEEGGVDFKDSSTILARYPEEAFKSCDLVFLWGINQYNFLKENRKSFNESKVIVSGHPRFEMLKPEFHAMYLDETDRIKKCYHDYVLFNTNMGFGNNIWGDSFVRDNYSSRIKHIDTVIKFDKKKIEAYISLIRRLAPVYKNNIVVRPHPEENINTYRDAFSGLDNVKVVYEGSVIPWILGSEVMIHPDCTTGIESLMLGKRSISYLPPGNEENACAFLPMKLSRQCITEDEVIDLIFKREQLKDNGENDYLLDDYFSFTKSSRNTIVGEVNELLKKVKVDETNELSGSYMLKRRLKDILRPFYMRIMNKNNDLFHNKLKGFDKKSVTDTFNTIRSVHDPSSAVEIERIFSSLYRIKIQDV